jgi:hypothetical protein
MTFGRKQAWQLGVNVLQRATTQDATHRSGSCKTPRAFWLPVVLLCFAAPAAAQAPTADVQRLQGRIAALEDRVARLSTALEAAQRPAAPPTPANAPPASRATRFALATLNLQAALATSKPYAREWQVLRELAPPNGFPAPVNDVLTSHAARGLATAAELRESFLALAPALAARAPNEGDWLAWLTTQLRSLLGSVGLVEPPTPSPTQATIANVAQLLTRGQVAAGLADMETLGAPLQPLVAGWVSQARARVAVEQAIQETLLRSLASADAN